MGREKLIHWIEVYHQIDSRQIDDRRVVHCRHLFLSENKIILSFSRCQQSKIIEDDAQRNHAAVECASDKNVSTRKIAFRPEAE